MQKLGWKEKYAGILVLSIGILFLLLQVIDLSSTKSSAYKVQESAILVNKAELYAHVRALVTIVTGILGGYLLLKGRTAGWILGVTLLILFLVFAIAGLVQLGLMRIFGISFIAIVFGVALLLLALLFLFARPAREKYKVGRNTYLPTLVFLLIIAAIYFFLQ